MTMEFIALAVGLATPIVAFLIYLLRRAPEIAQSSANTDATMVTSAGEVVRILQSQNALQQSQIQALNERLLNTEAGRISDQTEFTRQLNDATNESVRMNTIIAQLKNDSDIAQRQIPALRQYLPSDLPDNTQMLFKNPE